MAQQGGSLRAPVDSRLDRAKKTARAAARTMAVVVAGAAALLTTSIAPVRAGDATTAGATATVPLFDGLGGHHAQGDDRLARGAALLRPGPRVPVRLQPRRGDPLVPPRGRARPEVRDGLVGHRARQRAAHQQPASCRPSARRPPGRRSTAAKRAGDGREPGRAGADRRAAERGTPTRSRRTASRSTRPTPTRCARVWKQYPDDADVGALFAESLMDLRPWDLWTADGQPQPGTEEILGDARERCSRAHPNHPLAHPPLHPRRRGVAPPGEGRRRRRPAARPHARARPPGPHAVAHRRAPRPLGAGDRRQRAGDRGRPRATASACPDQGFYRVYMAHNHHMLAFARDDERPQRAVALATIRGDGRPGSRRSWLQRERGLGRRLPDHAARGADAVRPLGRGPRRARSRPSSPDLAAHCGSTRRGVARAAQGDVAGREGRAGGVRARREAACRRTRPSATTRRPEILDVAEQPAGGRDPVPRAARTDEGIAALREAVARARTSCATTSRPTGSSRCATRSARRSCGAGRFAEAEAVYREDLQPAARQRLGALRTPPRAAGAEEGRRVGGGGAAIRRDLARGGREDKVALPLPARGVRRRGAARRPSAAPHEERARAGRAGRAPRDGYCSTRSAFHSPEPMLPNSTVPAIALPSTLPL